jgi:hypothetical protein
MNRLNIVSTFTNRLETRLAGIALTALLGAALSSPAQAGETWKINMTKSHFSTNSNTLVLERYSGRAATQVTDAKGNPTANTFLVLSNGKVYLATDEAATDAASGKAVKGADYTRWRGMKLVQVGNDARTEDCGYFCKTSRPNDRITLTFTAKGIDVSGRMSDVAVLNTP